MVEGSDREKLTAFMAESGLVEKSGFPWDAFNLGELLQAAWTSGKTDVSMIRLAGTFRSFDAVRFLLRRMNDTEREIRVAAENALGAIAQRLTIPASEPPAIPLEKIVDSALFSRIIHGAIRLKPLMPRLKFLFEILLKIGGRGPHTAWKVFKEELYPRHIITAMLRDFPPRLRMVLVREYSEDDLFVRRRFCPEIRSVLSEIEDPEVLIDYISDLYITGGELDPLLLDLFRERGLREKVAVRELKSTDEKEKLKGIRVIGMLDEPSGYYAALALLHPEEARSVQLACMKMLARSRRTEDTWIINGVTKLLSSDDWEIRFQAFRTLVALKAQGLGQILSELTWDYPLMEKEIYSELAGLGLNELNKVISFLDESKKPRVRAAVATALFREYPEALTAPLSRLQSSRDGGVAIEAKKTRITLDLILEKEPEPFTGRCTHPPLSAPGKKGLWERLINIRQENLLHRFRTGKPVERARFNKELFRNLDLSGIKLSNVNFENASLSNINFKGAEFIHVNFRNTCLENVKMAGALFRSVSFEKAKLKNVDFSGATFTGSEFNRAGICGASFSGGRLSDTAFAGATLHKTTFVRSDLTEADFTGASLLSSDFSGAALFGADFSGAGMGLCQMDEGFREAIGPCNGADFNARSPLLSGLSIHPCLCDGKTVKIDWLNRMVLLKETETQRNAFLSYNNRAMEKAMDLFTPEQGDLFELIPLLIHLDVSVLPDGRLEKYRGPSGIFQYIPSLALIRLAEKRFRGELTYMPEGGGCSIEGLYTIGSIGSVAQGEDSDIDYWVCVDEKKIGAENLALLKEKLAGIEKWSMERMKTEVHFFVVDLTRVRLDQFGGSDEESSGSAQGKILKAEFYRAMIRVAGKVPFWCVFPVWMDNRYYASFCKMVQPLGGGEYLDLGNVAEIPRGEYFGAAIWQIVKSMKSPFKSVMKMALLEKTIRFEGSENLLCNRLKGNWASGKKDHMAQDPYIVLFSEIYDYYRQTDSKKAYEILLKCFLLKLGVARQTATPSLFGIKEGLVKECIARWCEQMDLLDDLRRFDTWSFDDVKTLSGNINEYLVDTYKQLNLTLQKDSGAQSSITPEDLTILGRKMIAHFSRKPHKVARLPLVSHGKNLFRQLSFEYLQEKGSKPVWVVYPDRKRSEEGKTGQGHILVRVAHMEEAAVWLVQNDLYLAATKLNLVPNPTSVSTMDLHELLSELHRFFPPGETGIGSEKELLEKPAIKRMFIVVNFGADRKLNVIKEYSAIYLTSWGELFCRVFTDERGLHSARELLERLRTELDLPFDKRHLGGYVPTSARQRITLDFKQIE